MPEASSKCRHTHDPTSIHSCSFTETVTEGLCSHQWRWYSSQRSSCWTAVRSLRHSPPSGARMGKENTEVCCGRVTSASTGTPWCFRYAVRGSLLSPRTVRTKKGAWRAWMPEAASTSWLTVPEGLTHVIAADAPMPSWRATWRFVATEAALSRCSTSARGSPSGPARWFAIMGLSMMPVRDTPSRRSSTVFWDHSGPRYLKSTSEA
mmetsp:Transcript_13714/g.26294  ORF Transcript_13714/g.26294 Transcript_13714/m.26294 type:complete len:207 (+) Transcript_13714:546-1166(+)